MILMNFNNRNDNFGDQLISYLLYNELKLHDEVHFINTKPEIISSHPLRIRKALIKTIWYRLTGRKVILFDPPCARVYIKNLHSRALKDLVIDWLLQKCISERHVIGISIDPRISPQSFAIYNTVGVRDNASFEHINKNHQNVFFTPDMACLMPPKKSPASGKKILISFRKDTPDNNYSSEYSEKIKSSLPLILNVLSVDKSDTVFYSQVDEDYEYNSDLSLRILRETKVITINKKSSSLPYPDLFSDCEYVISNRLHVLLPAMIEGVLAIALISRNHKKIVDLLTSYDLENTIVFIESGDKIEESIREIVRDKDKILKSQYEKLKKINLQLKNQIKAISL